MSFVLQNENEIKGGTAGCCLDNSDREIEKRKRRGKRPRKCHRSESAVEVQRSELWSRRRRARLIVRGLSPGTSPSVSPRSLTGTATWPSASQWRGGLDDRLQILRSTGCCCRRRRRRRSLLSPSAATPIEPPACVIHPARGAKSAHVRRRHVRATCRSRCGWCDANWHRDPEVVPAFASPQCCLVNITLN